MLKKLLLIPVIAGMAFLGVAVNNHYQTTKAAPVEQVEATSPEVEELNKEITQLSDQTASLLAEQERLQAECQKGRQAYEKLAPRVQLQTQAPVCTEATPE